MRAPAARGGFRRALAAQLTALAVCAWASSPGRPAAEVIDRVLAVVNGQVITLSDVRTVGALGLVTGRDEREVVARLVDRTLVLDEVTRYVPAAPADGVLDARIAGLRASVGESRLDAVLRESGWTGSRLREHVRQDLLIEAYIAQRFAFTEAPTDDEVEVYARQHPDRFAGKAPAETSALARTMLVRERRDRLVSEWLNGLRRRAVISIRPATP
jgi:hypothetical protein